MIRSIVVLITVLLLSVSCSGGSDTERAQVATSTPSATGAPPAAADTPGLILGPDDSESKQTTAGQHDWEYSGFTHTPVDFPQLMSEESLCPSYPALQPFFNYFITSHTEGPKKWYLASCSKDPVKVYLPVKALLRDQGIRMFRDEVTGGSEGAGRPKSIRSGVLKLRNPLF